MNESNVLDAIAACKRTATGTRFLEPLGARLSDSDEGVVRVLR
jgi:hypothetical protein